MRSCLWPYGPMAKRCPRQKFLLLPVIAIVSLQAAGGVVDATGTSATASSKGSYASGVMQSSSEYDYSGEAANGPEIVPGHQTASIALWHAVRTLLGVQATQRALHYSIDPSAAEPALEAESGVRRLPSRLKRRQLLARLQAAVGSATNTTTADSIEDLTSGGAAGADPDSPADTDAATADTSTATAADAATATNTPTEVDTAAPRIPSTGQQRRESTILSKFLQHVIINLRSNATLSDQITNTTNTLASHGGLLYDLTLDTSDLVPLRSDLETSDKTDLDSLGSELITLDASDLLQIYEQTGLLQSQIFLAAINATTAATTTAEDLRDADASMASKPGKVTYPVTDWPAVPPGWLNPRPPCVNGMVQQDMVCVCPPGSGTNPAYNGCILCPDGWVSVGGPLMEARCIPCPQFTKSNTPRTACVIAVGQPDVNQALCKTCFDPFQPFAPPACCPKGQVCCGTLGCCAANNCINNATTNGQPFCCEAASPPCPNLQGKPFGLNCCQKGTTCFNTSTTTQTCCPIGGVCLGSTPTNNKCCNPPQGSTCAVDRLGVAQCCSGPFCLNANSGNGACCNAGQYCIEQRLCCTGINAQICRTPAPATSPDSAIPEQCCGGDGANTCISSPLNPGLRFCCPATTASFVCGNSCCIKTTQQCVNQSLCCDNAKVCPSPLNPNVEICCTGSTSCDPVTKTCK